ncbi:glucose-6-phosphate dehydrogenase [Buchnera aphidicola]|uniref:Glucose-6-phosphate 1-dehydrogenase n=1 Tax=Buchnera aphidicola (Anoecia oenotherae) TaxID=1241833 RepID=A0A4D6XVA8_9GAMM|nr:glucose-6-phosphate dehydrogenase [Buchnera aphidicola]QCI19377.1 glucose-6-phosphate dehydrogenase [Buchnera aphidicola (Anoecia oenotherae)]
MVYSPIELYDIVIFGAKGDLVRRKLIPALYNLESKQHIHENTRIIAVGRAKWSSREYCDMILKNLITFLSKKIDYSIFNKFKSRFVFCNLDVSDHAKFFYLKDIIKKKNSRCIYYLAMPHYTFSNVCLGLKKFNLNDCNSRVVVEKPIGISLETSKLINNVLGTYFRENQIFRIDHYLGKETVLNLLSFRFANLFIYNNWNKSAIDSVQVTLSEEIGLEGRVDFFNSTGQTRDMVQSHLLQLLTLITMSKPYAVNADIIRDEKVKILKSLKPITKNNVKDNIVLGQYHSGFINKKPVKSYLNDLGNDNIVSDTETFIAIKVEVDNEQWNGVPFYIRTGKRLLKKCSEIIVNFKNDSNNIFNKILSSRSSNQLIITLQPNEGLKINIFNRKPGVYDSNNLVTNSLNFSYKKSNETFLNDYERLFLEVIRGNQSLFVRRDEVELAWNWIDSMMYAWKDVNMKPILYQSGTWGPDNSDLLLNKDGRYWYNN